MSLGEFYSSIADGEREVFRQNLLILAQDGLVQTDLTDHLFSSETCFVLQ
jgi:hypothetical protein